MRDVVYRADFVVGVHDADDSVAVAESRGHIVGIDDAIAVYGYRGDVVTIFFELLGGVNDGVVLDLGDDDVAGFFERRGDPFDRHIVGFSAAAGENDFAGAAVQNGCDAGPCLVDGVAGFSGDRVETRGVAERLVEVRQHRLEHFWSDRRCRGVIQIYETRRIVDFLKYGRHSESLG